jgi:hypothetical protein
MNSGLPFLIAAKLCDIAELQRLALTSSLVDAMGHLIHALQRERGMSNLVLGSQGARCQQALRAQVQDTADWERALRQRLSDLDTAASSRGHGARLFSRIAYVLQGLDALPLLRERVEQLAWTPARATSAYIQLINGLLAVVFEAADSASDPLISRQLVALFNFMQAKEFAGQERATGSALFAAGQAEPAAQQRLLHLIESQERCLQVFQDFAREQASPSWADAPPPATPALLERLRRILCTAAPGAPLDTGLSQAWFDACTQGIDAMKRTEEQLCASLRTLCEARTNAATADLIAHQQLLERPADGAAPFDEAASFFGTVADRRGDAQSAEPAASQGYGPEVARSILDLVQDQARRLQVVSDELETVRASLNERRLIERAKGLLMAHRSLREDEAHKTLRQMAMNQNRRIVDVAEALLSMAEVLPERSR